MKKAVIYFAATTGKKQEFYFTLCSKNGGVLATSETYTRKSNVKKAIERNFTDFKIIDTTKGQL